MTFDDATTQLIFGHEAAEDERIDRLKQYYFKGKIYEKITADLPLRILVGQKGIGKSALFKIAIEEDIDRGTLPILLRPDDVVGIDPAAGFLSRIKDWKYGLQGIIGHKILDSFGVKQDGKFGEALRAAGKTLGFIQDTLRPLSQAKIDLTPSQKALITKFLKKAEVTVYLDDLDRGWRGRPEDIQGYRHS